MADERSATAMIQEIEFAPDSPLEGGGFELPVPDEGLAFVCRVMGLLFGAQLLGFEKRPDSLAGRAWSWSN